MKVNGERHRIQRADEREGAAPESLVVKTRDRKGALKLSEKSMKRCDRLHNFQADELPFLGAALREVDAAGRQATARSFNRRAGNSHVHSDDESAQGTIPGGAKSAESRVRS